MRRLCTFTCVIALALAGSADAQPLEVGELVVADEGAVSIIAIDPSDGSQRIIGSGGLLVAPHAGAVDPVSLRVYVADREAGSGTLGAIIRINPATYNPATPESNQQLVSQDGQLEEPLDVFVERDRQLLVAEGGGSAGVVRVDPASGTQTRVFDHAGTSGVAADLFGTVYAASSIGTNEIRRSPPTPPGLVSSDNLFTANGHIAFEPDGTLVVVDLGVASALDGQVIRVNPKASPVTNQTLVSNATNLVDPSGVAVGADGKIYVADPAALAGAGAVYAVDPVTGVQTLVATGTPLADPTGIDVARKAIQVGEIAVADSIPRNVVLIDPETGAQRLVRRFASPLLPFDVEFDANGDLLVLLAGNSMVRPRILRMDPTTGLSEPVYIAGPPAANDLGIPTKMIRDGNHVFVSDYRTFTAQPGAIFDIDLVSGTKTLVMQYVATGPDPFVVQLLAIGLVPSDGDFLVLAEEAIQEAWEFARVDRTSLARDLIIADCIGPCFTQLIFPTDLVVTPDSATAYVTLRLAEDPPGGGAVVAVDLAAKTESVLTVPGELDNPLGIAFDAQGDLLVAHRHTDSDPDEGQIMRVDPDLPDPTPVLVSGGGLLSMPRGLTVYMPEPPAALSQAVGLLALAALARRSRRTR